MAPAVTARMLRPIRLASVALAAFAMPALAQDAQTAADLAPGQEAIVGRLVVAAADYARREGLADAGYRMVMNCNEDGGQTVFQLHLHLLAGAPLGRFGTPG